MANTPINKVQPMREAEIDIADYINGDLANELVDLHNTDAQLQKNIDAEQERAEAAEKKLTLDLATEVERAKAAEKVLTDDLATEVERATSAEGVLQTNINTENKRAVAAEDVLNGLYGDLAAKFPVQTENIGDAQVTEAKLEADLQTLLEFCKTLPDFEFGYSEVVSIPASGTTSVEITFNKTFDETPQVFTEVMCNTLNNILVSHVTYVDTTKATIKLYNGGVGQVDNVTVDYLALAGR